MSKVIHKVKVRKIGNSLGVTIPKEALTQMNLVEGDQIMFTKCEDGYRVTPHSDAFEEAMGYLEEGMRKYRNALRELAK